MAVLEIRRLPDAILRQKAKQVRTIDASIMRLIRNMVDTLDASSGVGLAAPQVGVSLRVIVVGLPDEQPFTLINPSIVRRKGERVVNEGCLSIPGYVGQIKRAESVVAKGRDASGKEVRIHANDLLAEVLEHEIDHINGVLYVDHLEPGQELRKIEPPAAGQAATEAPQG